MPYCSETRTTVAILTLSLMASAAGVSGAGCVDPGQSFRDFDERVIDAAPNVVGGSCRGGEIPDVSGEFYLALSPSFAPDALLRFQASTTLSAGAATTIAISLQPICVNDQCTVGEPVGDPILVDAVDVTSDCTFEAQLVDAFIPGGANPVSGSDIIGNIQMLGSLKDTDLYCGVANGTADVSGSKIPIDNSSFGAVRITGENFPEAVAACPEETEEPDAGPVDAGSVDAGAADASEV